jgi:alanyl-tRNA synthetase
MKFPGSRIFTLKATHGLPIDAAIERIHSAGIAIDWYSFIEEARANRWYDFKTIAAIQTGLEDSMTDKKTIRLIIDECKRYVMQNKIAF